MSPWLHRIDPIALQFPEFSVFGMNFHPAVHWYGLMYALGFGVAWWLGQRRIYLTAAYLAESSRWGRHALLEAGRSLTALQRTKEALVVYRKLMPKAFVRGANRAVLAAPPSIRVADPEDRVMQAEAAYGIAEILAGVGDQEAALDMYLTAAHLTAGTRAEDRALVGAIRSFVTMGDRASAELIYRRLQDSADRDPAVLAEARKNLGRRGNTAEQGGGSALPRGVLE